MATAILLTPLSFGLDAADRRLSMPRCGNARWRLRAEELHEASLDLFVALLELIGVGVEQLQVAELRFVRGVRDAGMARVETLGVGEHLLHLFAEGEVREELGGLHLQQRGAAGDRKSTRLNSS